MTKKMTIKEARRICKDNEGRLPRVGREMHVYSGDYVSIYLQNIAGTYKLRTWHNPNDPSLRTEKRYPTMN
jgi:hypothetical protein